MNSLAVRLFPSATVWNILTLLAAGLLLSDLNEKTNFEAFDDRLNLLLETLIGASRVDSSDSITVVSSIGDPRFFQPYSGWYWQVSNGAKTLSRSRSMWDQVFTADKRLIGGRSQFIGSLGNTNKKNMLIETKKLHIVERQISFPGIRNDDFGVEDSLVLNFPAIPANTSANDVIVDLSGYRIFADNNEVSYNIVSATENTQTGPNAGPVTISETDEITANVDISGLTIESAFGIVLAQTVLLGDNDVTNDTGSEILDVFNDNEAEVTTIDGLDEFSDQIDGFKFTEPIININYNTNIRIETTIYAALVGVDADGNTVYLSGNAGGPNEVTASDPITGLVANGQQLNPDQLVKFSIDNVSDCQNSICQIAFNINTTNVDDFLNNLPSDIRFVGRAVVNESENEASITTPLEFTPGLNVDLPLAFSTEVGNPANFTDTTDVSLDLGDDTNLTEGQLFILYTNDLPIGLHIFLSFQDTTSNTELFTLPNPGNELRLVASPVDDVTGFATGGQENNTFMATLTEEQLTLLKQTNIVEFSINLRSSENKAVRLRASDSFRLSLGARIKIENKIGGK